LVDCKEKLAESVPTEDSAWYSKLQGVQQNKNKAFEIWNLKGFQKLEEYHNST
jgi:hypothetical protein